jgi:hypothetical protein
MNFLDGVPKKAQIPNFNKTLPVGAESFHANSRQKERLDEGNVDFLNIANAPTNDKKR